MFWAFDSPASRAAGAFPPEALDLSVGYRASEDRGLHGTSLQRAWALVGRSVEASDCGPVRLLARTGYVVRAPGRIVVGPEEPQARWRVFERDSASFGGVRVGGDPWPGSESGFVASWIAGSDFAKLHTGVVVFYPLDTALLQAPVPNRGLALPTDRIAVELDVMAGLESPHRGATRVVRGRPHAVAALTVIARVPREAPLEIARGTVLAWFLPVLRPRPACLLPLPLGEGSDDDASA